MSETPAITTERVDDIPLLLQQMKRMDLPQLLDAHFVCHGNWQGLSLGWVATIWLAHILSEADHRLNQVQPWAEHRLTTLRACTRRPVQPLDLTDDRLAQVLRTLSDDAEWTTFERALTRTVLRVYDLRPAQVRVDSTTASGYWQVSEDGLFQFGHSKDHRPDLPQLKVLLATLDPLGLPVATDVLSGERADDPLYLPAIQRVRTTLGQRGLLYIGDCKMASLATRAGVQAGGDYYLCPLPAVQVPPETLASYLAGVQDGTQPVQAIHREQADGTQEQLADGFEVSVTLTAAHDGWPVTWTERRLVIRSLAQARPAEQALRARLAEAGYRDVDVRTVLHPAWATDWISEEGRRKLAEHGISPPGAAPRHDGPVTLSLLPTRRALSCPRCGSPDVELTSEFGATACRALYRCGSCLEPFEHVKEI